MYAVGLKQWISVYMQYTFLPTAPKLVNLTLKHDGSAAARRSSHEFIGVSV